MSNHAQTEVPTRTDPYVGGVIIKCDTPNDASQGLEIQTFHNTSGPFIRIKGREKDNVTFYCQDWKFIRDEIDKLVAKERLLK